MLYTLKSTLFQPMTARVISELYYKKQLVSVILKYVFDNLIVSLERDKKLYL